jgi:hypothetical protein
MFNLYDCEKCGGFYPGNPNSYMGTWCMCPREPEVKSVHELAEDSEEDSEDCFDWNNASTEEILHEIEELTDMRDSLGGIFKGGKAAKSFDLVIEELQEILNSRKG